MSEIALTQHVDFTPKLDELSAQIHQNALRLSWYLQSKGYPQPSLDKDTSVKVLPPDADDYAHTIRHCLKRDALQLFRLVSGPEEYVAHVAMNHQLAVCLRWLCKFRIFSIVPVQGSISYSNVAILVSVNEAELKSVCRMAITSGLFTEPETNRIAHTATSSLLATNADFAGWATCVTDNIYESSSKMGWAAERWPKSTLPSHSAFNLAYSTSMPFIDYMRQSPSLSTSFSSFLRATQSVEANSFRHLMNSFDWESIGSGVIVEIGSSTADPCIKLAQKFPLLRFHLQPLPRSTREVKAHVESLESEFASRFTVESDLMFAPQPKRNVDVFLLRHALHHFPEETSLSILGNIATVLDPRARILVMDLVLPLNAAVDPYQESMCRMRDLIHRALSNGQTRHLSEWNLLFQKAHKCFEIVSAVTPSGSDLTMLEIQIKDDRATKEDPE